METLAPDGIETALSRPWPDPGRRHTAAAMSVGYIGIGLLLPPLGQLVFSNKSAPPTLENPVPFFLSMFALALTAYFLAFTGRERVLTTRPPHRLPGEDDDSQIQARVSAAVMGSWALVSSIAVLGFIEFLFTGEWRQYMLFTLLWLLGAVRAYPTRRRWKRGTEQVVRAMKVRA